jgi:hypothetical protein
MINPVVGVVVHAIRRHYDLDQLERGIRHEEAKVLWDKGVKELLAESRLRLAETIPFFFGLNRLYIGERDVWAITYRQGILAAGLSGTGGRTEAHVEARHIHVRPETVRYPGRHHPGGGRGV